VSLTLYSWRRKDPLTNPREALDRMLAVCQLLKARLITRIWGAATWQAYESHSRRVNEALDAAAVRIALRRDTNWLRQRILRRAKPGRRPRSHTR